MSIVCFNDKLKQDINSNMVQNSLNDIARTTNSTMDINLSVSQANEVTSSSLVTSTSSTHYASSFSDTVISEKCAGATGSHMSSGSHVTGPHVKECASCGQKIWDRYLLSCMERHWHTGCLKCSCCQAPLGDIGGSCFAKGGMILCKNDYLRLFGRTGTCHSCGNGIPANEFVMKVQGNYFFHLNCFTCVVCQHRLTSGDRYCLVSGNLLCELDYPKVIKGTVQLPLRMPNRT